MLIPTPRTRTRTETTVRHLRAPPHPRSTPYYFLHAVKQIRQIMVLLWNEGIELHGQEDHPMALKVCGAAMAILELLPDAVKQLLSSTMVRSNSGSFFIRGTCFFLFFFFSFPFLGDAVCTEDCAALHAPSRLHLCALLWCRQPPA